MFGMFNKISKYSYADQKQYTKSLWNFIFKIIALIVAYIMITNIFFHIMVMESRSMQPSVNPGDRIVFSAFSLYGILEALSIKNNEPYKRGSIVVVDPGPDDDNPVVSIMDRVIRFFTIGKVGFPGKANDLFIKRVIGLPGDEITITNYVVKIRPEGSPYTLTEYELSDKIYDISIPQVSTLWDESIPFSGNMDKIILGADECFLLSDDRSNTNDSRTWGPLKLRNIKAKALFRYWPFTRISPL